jgi:hypothetical protein
MGFVHVSAYPSLINFIISIKETETFNYYLYEDIYSRGVVAIAIVGNIEENNKFHPSNEQPLELYCHDFDGNGTNDIVSGEYQNNICYPVRGRQCSSEQMPFIKVKFPTYSDFATADLLKKFMDKRI